MFNILLPQKQGRRDRSESRTKLMFFEGADNQGENGRAVGVLGD